MRLIAREATSKYKVGQEITDQNEIAAISENPLLRRKFIQVADAPPATKFPAPANTPAAEKVNS